jgi:hypothetical protein
VFCVFFHLRQCKIITHCLFLHFFLQQQPGPSPVPVPQQAVKTFTPANPAGLKNPGQYQQPNTLGSQLYTVGILVTYIYYYFCDICSKLVSLVLTGCCKSTVFFWTICSLSKRTSNYISSACIACSISACCSTSIFFWSERPRTRNSP